MDKVTDLEVIRCEKKERRLYCGEDAHPMPFACPRIAHVVANEDYIDLKTSAAGAFASNTVTKGVLPTVLTWVV